MPDISSLVINTGPLLALTAACGNLKLLATLYREVVVPSEVCQEIEAGGAAGFGLREFHEAVWLKKRALPVTLSPFLCQALDRGEGSVIQLALEERIRTVAIDEPAGRRMARLHGLALTGSIGILLRGKREGHISSIREALNRMKAQGIWLGAPVIAFALRESGEV